MAFFWSELETKKVFEKLKTGEEGLTEEEARERLLKFGPNELEKKKQTSKLEIFLNQFKSVLVLILIFATVFSALIGEILDAAAILVIVILNAIFGFVQEYKAEKTIETLKKLTSPEAVVIREGKPRKIPSKELVLGDIVVLEEGSRVPADLRIFEAIDLRIDESMITGESVPVTKKTEPTRSEVLAERKNIAWTGTIVVGGRGKGIVVETGMETEMGRIAKKIQEPQEQTPLQKKLDVFGKNLGIIILVICALVAGIGIFRESILTGKPLTTDVITSMIITGIALAVAAIPEGLPAVVTITLALGLQRLARHNALMRRLPAVETLGSTTVICSDKTGTLTRNEMTVKKIYCENNIIEVTGEGYIPKGGFLIQNNKIDPKKTKTLSLLLTSSALCNNAVLDKKQNSIIGDPTEGALIVLAEKAGFTKEYLEKAYPRVNEIPFSSERKMMTTVHKIRNGFLVCSKGAPEKILPLCKLSQKQKDKILKTNEELAKQALRVLAVAYKETKNRKNPEKDLVFLGLVGMIDPPRKEVKKSIEECKKAGIRVIMITGDHKNTAEAIAKEIGISGNSITGEELEKLSESRFQKIVDNIGICARVNPEHKVKILDALKSKNHIVAMTGDGVNDAPALKKADIGIAMGKKGTDVAKEASDMILRDDNFTSIVKAVKEGRGIYDNIKKFIQYLLSSNLGEVLIVFIAMLIGFTNPETGALVLPITAIQLLWINLLTDGLPALALGVDPPAEDIMQRPPRDPKEKILSRGMLINIILVGIIMCIGTLSLFAYNLESGATKAVTVAFTTIVMFEMIRIESVRMKFKTKLLSNKKLITAVLASVLLQIMVVYLPFFQPVFQTTALDFGDWIEILGVASTVFALMWIKQKMFPSRL
ncbi:MAG: ATPase [Candidatus Aenigmatarchaeota archaeon]|nr:MAG: ATPase [Candidatus Aenigmarchaeota archaeon]